MTLRARDLVHNFIFTIKTKLIIFHLRYLAHPLSFASYPPFRLKSLSIDNYLLTVIGELPVEEYFLPMEVLCHSRVTNYVTHTSKPTIAGYGVRAQF
jgi:hypothetical protein